MNISSIKNHILNLVIYPCDNSRSRPNESTLGGTITPLVRRKTFFDYPLPPHPTCFRLRWPWWRWTGSNRWPPACKAGALPAELHPRVNLRFTMDHWEVKNRHSSYCQASIFKSQTKLVGLDGVEPSTSRLSGVRSNQTELQAHRNSELRIRISERSQNNFSDPVFQIPNSIRPIIHLQLIENITWSLKTK